jgi:4-diphosphocytidyl-2-C-methyl-D-erythritol kinase
MTDLRAPAKLTWYLEITGRRDDGFHLVRSEMVTLDLADRLSVDESGDSLSVGGLTEGVPVDETNLVRRALRLVDRRAAVTIEKAIPTGGGLGGASADAGAVLRWAGGVSVEAAFSLGSDVPFCQLGGRALVEGVGELLTPLDFERREVTLFMPDFGVNTAACYQAFDELVANGWSASGQNHLEVPATFIEPRLARTLVFLRDQFGPNVHLAGSGSTLFVEGHVGAESSGLLGPEGPVGVVHTITMPA